MTQQSTTDEELEQKLNTAIELLKDIQLAPLVMNDPLKWINEAVNAYFEKLNFKGQVQ